MLALIATIHAATLSGDIYDADGIARLNNTIININGSVCTQIMANGQYSIELPESTYILTATHYKGGKIDYITKERVSLNQTNMKFDLVLIPYELYVLTPQSDPDLTKLTRQNISSTINATKIDPKKVETEPDIGLVSIGLGAIILLLFIAYFFVSKKRNGSTNGVEMQTQLDEEYVPDKEAREILRILGENEGRIYQKELRDILNWSEAKMSIAIGELERAGCVKRIRKGRDNLLKLTTKKQCK